MRDIQITFGESIFTNNGKLEFPPEKAKSKSTKRINIQTIDLIDNNKEMDKGGI